MKFEANRVNKINPREEFFRVSLDEIEEAARQYKADITLPGLPRRRSTVRRWRWNRRGRVPPAESWYFNGR